MRAPLSAMTCATASARPTNWTARSRSCARCYWRSIHSPRAEPNSRSTKVSTCRLRARLRSRCRSSRCRPNARASRISRARAGTAQKTVTKFLELTRSIRREEVAVRQLMALGPGQLEWRDIAAPQLMAATDALVRPIAVALCDADVMYLRGGLPPRAPFCLGHEFVAEIMALGEDVRGFLPGDRVVVAFLIACGSCKRCRQGYPAACLTVPPKSAYG